MKVKGKFVENLFEIHYHVTYTWQFGVNWFRTCR